MTEVITRSPLAALSMASSQRQTRRRSARSAFDEEDGPPSKKTKVDGEDVTEPRNGQKSTRAMKAKAAYDEDADGFQFSRARSKKPAPKPVVPEATESHTLNQQPSGRARRKKSTGARSPSVDADQPKRRRSARLSGEKPQQATEAALETQPASTNEAQVETTMKPPAQGEIQIPKQRRATKIALPFADTPVIQRNKEMRKGSSESRRRSSSSLRGRRASSLIDSGTSNAVPHHEVEPSDFYKHISQDLPEPRRMKQLLIWCGTRALPRKPIGLSKDVNASLAARVIQEELLKDFSNRSEMSDWFNREDVAPTALTKKPNPRNQENLIRLQELELEVKRLEEEKAGWDTLLDSLNTSLEHQRATAHVDRSAPIDAKAVDPALLNDAEQQSLLSNSSSRSDMLTEAKSRFETLTQSLEFKIDSFADGVHKMEKFKDQIDNVAGQIIGKATSVLEQRDKDRIERSGMSNVGVGDVLKTFSRIRE